MYFSEHKCAVEIDEKGHTDRNQDEENKRQTKIEKNSDCKYFHRINPDAEGFEIFLEISKIKNYITQSYKKIRKRKRSRNIKTKRQTKKTRSSNKRTKKEKNIRNSTTNQITNNFGKITLKS